MDTTLAVLAGLTPSVGVGLLFWFSMRKIFRADRHEREALDRMDREGMTATAENAANSPSR
ncbi:hypothetical protein APR04_002434 [Promicromonospora umidemergens]|uniref:Lysyl-tRNA synthetase n=1 Tax=Promicromonospora umidemergens TaxID=629679 RepID=A0ABP8WWA9_9MICO|nr:hypothetical protein [Promicromonospora umidemergens]MCP2283526.1 hypothetical protein [Promicromonospora umidemergens]